MLGGIIVASLVHTYYVHLKWTCVVIIILDVGILSFAYPLEFLVAAQVYYRYVNVEDLF